jgi:hypothetical protein
MDKDTAIVMFVLDTPNIGSAAHLKRRDEIAPAGRDLPGLWFKQTDPRHRQLPIKVARNKLSTQLGHMSACRPCK